ncbi:MAG TPA: TonB family protein [Pyrinomonadaceae bacterium]
MFRNLVESGSHATDIKRRGSFFAAAVAFYAILLTAAGIGSIYAVNVRLDDREELEVLALMSFPPQPATAEPVRRDAPRPAGGGQTTQAARRPEHSAIIPYDGTREVASAGTREVSPTLRNIEIGADNGIDPAHVAGPIRTGVPGGLRTDGPVVADDGDIVAPPARTPVKVEPPKPETPRVLRLASSIISSKAINKPKPDYPAIAIRMHVEGTVPVQILIDEQGRVVQAQATSGHPLLQKAAADAARRATFSPTFLSDKPIKASGVIYYNFVIQ